MKPEILYEDDEVTITEEDVDAAIDSVREKTPKLAEMLEAEPMQENDILG